VEIATLDGLDRFAVYRKSPASRNRRTRGSGSGVAPPITRRSAIARRGRPVHGDPDVV